MNKQPAKRNEKREKRIQKVRKSQDLTSLTKEGSWNLSDLVENVDTLVIDRPGNAAVTAEYPRSHLVILVVIRHNARNRHPRKGLPVSNPMINPGTRKTHRIDFVKQALSIRRRGYL